MRTVNPPTHLPTCELTYLPTFASGSITITSTFLMRSV